MKIEQQNKINLDMEDVIETSRKIRNYLLDDKISSIKKKKEISNLRLILEANKNIVASSNVKINVDRLNNGK